MNIVDLQWEKRTLFVGICQKTGTEQDIPIIKDGGYLKEGHYIKGFVQTMEEKYWYEQRK